MEGLEAGRSSKPGEPLKNTRVFESIGLKNWNCFSDGYSGMVFEAMNRAVGCLRGAPVTNGRVVKESDVSLGFLSCPVSYILKYNGHLLVPGVSMEGKEIGTR